MKIGPHRYKYAKQLGGQLCYGEVEIEINSIGTNSTVIDDCQWTTLKRSYPDFTELEALKIWKESAIEAALYIVNNYNLPKSLEIKIKDVVGLYVDTAPVHLGAATVIGIFDLIENPLSLEDINIIDDFVSKNHDFSSLPNYENMKIMKASDA